MLNDGLGVETEAPELLRWSHNSSQPGGFVRLRCWMTSGRTVDDFLVSLMFDALPCQCHCRVLIG
jgi:hypothetical protein